MDFILLQTFDNYIDANIVAGRLESEGIKCWLKDEQLVTTIPLWNTAVGGIKLMVPEDQLNKATELLKGFHAEKAKRFVCPNCGSANMVSISSPRKMHNWLTVLLGVFLFSYALPVKSWRCFDCDSEFKEPKEIDPDATKNGFSNDQDVSGAN